MSDSPGHPQAHIATNAEHRGDGPAEGRPSAAWRWLGWALVLTALAVVFLAYLSPHMAVDLASRLWSCF